MVARTRKTTVPTTVSADIFRSLAASGTVNGCVLRTPSYGISYAALSIQLLQFQNKAK